MHVLTTSEAAEVLRVCPATIRRMIRRGELDGVTRCSLGRVTLASIERLLGAPLHLADDPGAVVPDEAHHSRRLRRDSHRRRDDGRQHHEVTGGGRHGDE